MVYDLLDFLKDIKNPFVQHPYYETSYRNLLVTGQSFHTLYIDGECLVTSEDLVEGLHQLLLLSSHVRFPFIQDQNH